MDGIMAGMWMIHTEGGKRIINQGSLQVLLNTYHYNSGCKLSVTSSRTRVAAPHAE